MEQKANQFLETEPVGALMRRYAVPCIISLLVAALYNIVDQIFIANADYLGSYGNAANTVVFPLTVVALAVAVLIGDGACAFVSILLGQGRRNDAGAAIGNAVVLSAAGGIPVAGYNIGAGRRDRARALFSRLLVCEALVGLAALAVVELFPRHLIALFGAANESACYTAFAVKSFRVYLCMTALATVNKGTFIYLQAIGKALASTMISLIREVVFGVGFALLLPRFFGLDGVLYSMPVSDLPTFLIAAATIRGVYRELGADGVRNTPRCAALTAGG